MKDNQIILEINRELRKQAWKKALEVFPVLKRYARSIHNTDGIMYETLTARILVNEPIDLVGFWGVGDKDSPDENDSILLTHLGRVAGDVSHVYDRGAKITLILADEHGTFNGYPNRETYSGQIAALAAHFGMESVWLKNLYHKYGISLPEIDGLFDFRSEAWSIFCAQRDQLLESAARHNLRGAPPENAAYHYVAMRLNERNLLKAQFPGYILFVNGSKDLCQRILPQDVPIIYLGIGPVWFKKGV